MGDITVLVPTVTEHCSGEKSRQAGIQNHNPSHQRDHSHIHRDRHKYLPPANVLQLKSSGWTLSLAEQCKKKISSFTALPPVHGPWVCYAEMLYKLLDHIFTCFITKSSYRNYIAMSTLPSKVILYHSLKSLFLSQAFCGWATVQPGEPYLWLQSRTQPNRMRCILGNWKPLVKKTACWWTETESSQNYSDLLVLYENVF